MLLPMNFSAEGLFQKLWITQVFLQRTESESKIMAGADAFIHYHAHRQAAGYLDLTVMVTASHITQIAQSAGHAGCAEIINVMINMVGADAGQVRYQHTGVEGTDVNY